MAVASIVYLPGAGAPSSEDKLTKPLKVILNMKKISDMNYDNTNRIKRPNTFFINVVYVY